jgi:nitrate/TMAO reductase-like tetraheme cytochrome c subunit
MVEDDDVKLWNPSRLTFDNGAPIPECRMPQEEFEKLKAKMELVRAMAPAAIRQLDEDQAMRKALREAAKDAKAAREAEAEDSVE